MLTVILWVIPNASGGRTAVGPAGEPERNDGRND